MLIRTLFTVFLTIQSLCIFGEEFQIPEWYISESKAYVEKLKKVKPAASAHHAVKAAKKALQEERWALAVAEIESAVAKDPHVISHWLEFAYIAAIARGKENDYENRTKAQNAAVYVFLHSKEKTERARALLIMTTFDYSDEFTERCFLELTTFMSLPELRKAYPEYAVLSPFVYKDKEIRREGKKPNLLIKFAHSLPKDFKPQDYLDISPKIDGAYTIQNNQISLTGLKYGESYTVRIKEGIPSRFGEKTTQHTDIQVMVDERNAQLGFPKSTYILRKEEDLHLPLTAINIKRVKVEAYRINPRAFIEGFRRHNQSLDGGISDYGTYDMSHRYGEILYEGKMDVGGEHNTSVVKQIPLKTIIKDLQPGAYGVVVSEDVVRSSVNSAGQWVLITDIGMTLFTGSTGLDVSVRSLESAQPLGEVEVQLLSANNKIIATKKSTKDGWVHFEETLLGGKAGNRPYYIFAIGSDGSFTVQKLNEPAFDLADRGSGGRPAPGIMDAYLYSERGIYRPGETVRVNTLLRDMQAKCLPGIPLTFKLIRPDNQEVVATQIKGNDLGFYDVTFLLSPACRTGKWFIRAYADPTKDPLGELSVTVEDFVPSRLLVTLSSKDKHLTMQKPIEVDLYARFLFGAKAPNLTGSVSMTVRKDPNPFSKYEGYAFGLLDDEFTDKHYDLPFTALDADGKANLPLTLDASLKTTLPLQAVVRAEINDIGGRPRYSTHKLSIDLFPVMIGLHSASKRSIFPLDAKTAQIQVVALNRDGHLVSTELKGKLIREEIYYDWSLVNGSWSYKALREDHFIQDLAIRTAEDKETTIDVPIDEWGYYRLEVQDPKGGAATSYRFTKGYVSSEAETHSPDQLTLTLNKERYSAGDTVDVQISAPFDGEGILVVANEGILHQENIKINKKGSTFTLKADSTWGAGAYVMVSAFRALKAPKTPSIEQTLLPKRAIGLAWMALDPAPRTLKVNMTLPAEVKPRQTLTIPLEIKGVSTKNTLFTLAAVDEGILMLTDFQSPKPQDHFLAKRMLGLEMRDVYGKIMNAEAGDVGILRSGGDSGALERNLAALSKRSFRIVSLFQGPIAVDEAGKATVSVDLPDFNGTLRLMAVAYNLESTGSGEARLLVRDPIVVEAILPRFLAPGDASLVTISLHNNLKEKKDVRVTAIAEGAIDIEENPFEVTVESDGEAHHPLKLSGKSVGDGKIHITMTSPDQTSVTRTFEISCRPTTSPITRRESRYLKSGESMEIKSETYKDLIPQGREVHVMASDKLAWDMSAIAKNLVNYPYGCVEQTTGRGFGLLYKKNQSILAIDETTEDINRDLQKVIVTLSDKQSSSGGFPFWGGHDDEDMWVTAFAYDMLGEAKKRKISVPDLMMEQAHQWLRQQVKGQSSRNTDVELATAAYALFLLVRDEKIEDGAVRYFFDTFYPNISHTMGRVFVAAALVHIGDMNRAKRALGDLVAKSKEIPSALPFGSEIRNQAAVVWALSEMAKIATNMPEIATKAHEALLTLQELYRSSPYLSTQDNAWLLRAGLASPEAQTQGRSIVQILGKDQDIKGTYQHSYTAEELTVSGTIKNVGDKSLWVTTMVAGIPEHAQPAQSHGIQAQRSYYTLDGQSANLDSLMQGDQLVVLLHGRLEATDEMPKHYLIMADLLPAGLEIEGGPLPISDKITYPWKDLPAPMIAQGRDDRFIAAVKLTPTDMTFKVAYRVRAITPGQYVHPGLFVEDMYKPSLFARTAEGKVEIKSKDVRD